MQGAGSRTTTPDVKCRNCQNLGTRKDPKGLLICCEKGYYDHYPFEGAEEKIRVFYSVLALKSGNVGIWKAMNNCGPDYQIAGSEGL